MQFEYSGLSRTLYRNQRLSKPWSSNIFKNFQQLKKPDLFSGGFIYFFLQRFFPAERRWKQKSIIFQLAAELEVIWLKRCRLIARWSPHCEPNWISRVKPNRFWSGQMGCMKTETWGKNTKQKPECLVCSLMRDNGLVRGSEGDKKHFRFP